MFKKLKGPDLLKGSEVVKTNMKVDFYIFSAAAEKPISDDVVIEYKRAQVEGSQFTAVRNFGQAAGAGNPGAGGAKSMEIKEKFETLQSFYHTSEKGEWKPNNCVIKLLANQANGAKPKVLAEKKFDISSVIGQKSEPFDLAVGKGFSLKIRFNVAPACPKANAALFKKEVELGNKELFGTDDSSKAEALLAEEGGQETATAADLNEANLKFVKMKVAAEYAEQQNSALKAKIQSLEEEIAQYKSSVAAGDPKTASQDNAAQETKELIEKSIQTLNEPLADSSPQADFKAMAEQFAQTEAIMKEVLEMVEQQCQTEE